MTHDEMLTELEVLFSAKNSRDGFHTTEELAAAKGVDTTAMRKRLKIAEGKNRLEVKRFVEPGFGGRMVHKIGYKMRTNA